jgi:Short C-terminal domain
MLLVPRQLRRAGMTGNVPYYGGRLTPAHAYAVTHPSRPPQAATVPRPGPPPAGVLEALNQLYAAGVITRDEYHALRARVDA